VFAVVAGAVDLDVTFFNLDFKLGVNGLRKFSFGAFYGYNVVVNVYGYACGNLNGGFTYS
jgi:hypothetical protein